MPITSQHKQQRSKNIALLLILLTLVGVLFAITLLKFGQPA